MVWNYLRVYLFKDLKALSIISGKYNRVCDGLDVPVVDKVDLKKLYVAILTIESLKRPTIMLYPEYIIFFIKKLFNKNARVSLGDAQILTNKYISRKESIEKGFEIVKKHYNNAVLFSDNGSEAEIAYYIAYFYNCTHHYVWNVLNLYMLLCGKEVRRNTAPYTEPAPNEYRKKFVKEQNLSEDVVKKYLPIEGLDDIKEIAGYDMSFEEMKKIYLAVFQISPYCAKRYDNKIPFPDNWIKFSYFPFP